MSVYWFLRTNGRPQSIGAAVCAGCAFLVKQTFFAVPVAIVSWLIYRRRYREAVYWAAGVALTVAGGYALVWWREPLVLKHIAALRHPIFEYQGTFSNLWKAVSQPVMPFAAIGGFFALRRGDSDRALISIYCVAAWVVAILTVMQVGGNINYFWEPLVVSAVLAGPGLSELQRNANRAPMLVTAMLFMLVLRAFVPLLREEFGYLRTNYASVKDYQVRKAKWDSFVSVVSGRRLLSTFPDLTLLSMKPMIPDPFLNTTLELQGQWNFKPVIAEIDGGIYDLIVIGKGEAGTHQGYGYRGILSWDEGMWKALEKSYGLVCVFEGMEVWLPNHGSNEILPGLWKIGCLAPAKEVGSGSARP